MIDIQKYYRREEASRYLGVSLRTLKSWMKGGLIPFSKPSRKVVLIAKSDLDAFAEQFRRKAIWETAMVRKENNGDNK